MKRMFSCIPLMCRGRVDVIERNDCGLTEVPPEVHRCANSLEELYLDFNLISDISDGLCKCRKLRILSLSYNRLSRIPPSFGSLEAIEELNLEGNDELNDLPRELEECSQLKILKLRLSPFLRLPEVVTKLTSLTHLDLFETSLTQLPADIGSLENLCSLDVRENQIRVLPVSVGELKQLKVLDVGRNELLALPLEIGNLERLEDLYVDHNLLSALPESLVRCRCLQNVDVSQNDLASLPEQFGDLENIVELNISENRISSLPNSVCRLKKMTVLKADSNSLTALNVAIGSCVSLQELYLANNQLSSLPSSLGNLKGLDLLTLDENQITDLPLTIGGCSKLSILSVRGNELKELPLEIGRLANLRVLDVCDNYLIYLPFTVNVLFNLRALWLSIDQSCSLIPLKTALDPVTRVKVLTCYLLPQGSCQEFRDRRKRREGNIRFEGDSVEAEGDSDSLAGNFVRRGTPHPKARTRFITPRRHSIDGRFIPHSENEDNGNEPTIVLRRKSAADVPESRPPLETVTAAPAEKSLICSIPEEEKVENEICNESVFSRHNISIDRDEISGYGLTLAGGRDSEPFKGDDPGLFISRVTDGGPSDTAGLVVGDKVITVNGNDVSDKCHREVARMMQQNDHLDLLVERDSVTDAPRRDSERTMTVVTESFLSQMGKGSSVGETTTLSTTVQCDLDGSFGFTIGSTSDSKIVVTSVEGTAERNGSIHVGDTILSINGTNVSSVNVEEAHKLLSEDGAREAFLVVKRNESMKVAKLEPIDGGDGNVEIPMGIVEIPAGIVEIPAGIFDGFSKSDFDEELCEVSSKGSLSTQILPSLSPATIPDESVNSADPSTLTHNTDRAKSRRESEPAVILHSARSAPSKTAPPVAPKPKPRALSFIAVQNEDTNGGVEPSQMDFSSKLKKFESAAQLPQSGLNRSLGVPAKKRLVSEEDLKKMKEEEDRKVAATLNMVTPTKDDRLERIFNLQGITRSAPAVVRTKNAERRMEGANSPSSCSPVSESAIDMEKRQMWRQARYKSLEAASENAERVMEQVREISSRLGSVAEESDLRVEVSSPLHSCSHNTPLYDESFNDSRAGAEDASMIGRGASSLGISA